MKFLLVGINAKYIHSNPAVYSLYAYAKEHVTDVEIEIGEYTINNQMEDVLADIYKRKPDVIGFSCYIWNWNMIQDIMVELHKLMPNTPIWLGGPEVSYEPELALKQYPFLAGIMVGEGEKTFVDLLEYYKVQMNVTSEAGTVGNQCKLENGQTTNNNTNELECSSNISGIVTTSGRTPCRELILLDEIPFIYDDLSVFANRIIYYESSRGCPYRCSYCLSSIDKTVRLRSMNLVKKELQFFLDNQVPQVKFIDRTFNCNHKHAMAIWQYIYDHDNGVTNFHFEISADILSEAELELLNQMRPGLVQLEIGVQSTNPETITEIDRTMDLEKLKKIFTRIEAGKNIHQHLDLIVGLPYETYEKFQISFQEIYALHPEQLQLGFLKVLKGAKMYEKTEEYGIGYQSKPPYEVLFTSWISYEEIRKLKAIEEMVELYYNSNQFVHTLKVLETAFDNSFAMYESMANFYVEAGYAIASPARSYRYEVLLQFATKVDGAQEELYKELLTYDCYLRENMKTRPSYAKDLSPYKDTVREFYQQEEVERNVLCNYGEYNWKQMAKMTHVEMFSYHVWEDSAEQMCKKLPLVQMVLFDYKERSPLTAQAKIYVI